MRHDLADRVKVATEHELEEQTSLRATEDFKEGVGGDGRAPRAEFQGAVIFLSAHPRESGGPEKALGPAFAGTSGIQIKSPA